MLSAAASGHGSPAIQDKAGQAIGLAEFLLNWSFTAAEIVILNSGGYSSVHNIAAKIKDGMTFEDLEDEVQSVDRDRLRLVFDYAQRL